MTARNYLGDAMPTVLITGANRGIGLEFARQYAADGWQVIAACRNPDKAEDLRSLAGNLSIARVDYDDFDSIGGLATELDDTAIDHLILNAGFNLQRGASLADTNYARWQEVFQANTIGPFRTATAFADHVAASDAKTIIALGSVAGSFSIQQPGNYLYRSAKAALHNIMKALAGDLAARDITVTVFHPGRVRNDGAPDNPLEVADSVAEMRKAITGLTAEQSGCFLNYDGAALPW